MSRTDLDSVIHWGRANNFRRIRFQTGWDDFIADWKTNQREGWGPGPVLVERKTPRFSGKRAERNSAGGGLVRASMEMGIPVENLYQRHTGMVEWMAKTHGILPRNGGEIAFMGGSAQTEGEVTQFEWAIDTYHPRIAVIMVPLGLELDGSVWDHVYFADSAQHGEVLAGVWQIGMQNLVPIHCFVEEPANRPLCTIFDRFRQCGITPLWRWGRNRGHARSTVLRRAGSVDSTRYRSTRVESQQPYSTTQCE